MSSASDLPAELVELIFTHLPIKDLGKVNQVSKEWNEIATSSALWKERLQQDWLSSTNKQSQEEIIEDGYKEIYLSRLSAQQEWASTNTNILFTSLRALLRLFLSSNPHAFVVPKFLNRDMLSKLFQTQLKVLHCVQLILALFTVFALMLPILYLGTSSSFSLLPPSRTNSTNSTTIANATAIAASVTQGAVDSANSSNSVRNLFAALLIVSMLLVVIPDLKYKLELNTLAHVTITVVTYVIISATHESIYSMQYYICLITVLSVLHASEQAIELMLFELYAKRYYDDLDSSTVIAKQYLTFLKNNKSSPNSGSIHLAFLAGTIAGMTGLDFLKAVGEFIIILIILAILSTIFGQTNFNGSSLHVENDTMEARVVGITALSTIFALAVFYAMSFALKSKMRRCHRIYVDRDEQSTRSVVLLSASILTTATICYVMILRMLSMRL